MPLSNEFWLQIVVYVSSFAMAWGSIHTRIKYLESKMDKHNGVIERMAVAEQSIKSAHHRIDEMREELS